MQLFQVSEGTAAQRRLFFHAVDATDGITAETGLTGTGFVSENGATPVASSGSLTELNATNMPGRYYIELTAAELSTVGDIEFRFKAAACAEVVARGQVVPWDPYSALNMGLTALPAVAAEGAGGLYTRGTGLGQINQDANGRIDTNVAAMVAGAIASGVIAAAELTNIEDEIWDALKSAHVVANSFGDFLDIEVSGRAIAGDAMDLVAGAVDATAIATGAIDADAIAANAFTAAKFAADYLTAINGEVVNVLYTDTITELSVGIPATNPTIASAVMLVYMALRNKMDQSTSIWEIHNDAGTIITTKAKTDSGGIYSEAKMISG